MFWRMILSVMLAWSAFSQGAFSSAGLTLPKYLSEQNNWLHGRAIFKGAVIIPTCTLAMEDTWQAIDMGNTPVRDLQHNHSGLEKKFFLRLRNCELSGDGGRVYTGSRIRVTFDGPQDGISDDFLLIGQARGISLQILDRQGYKAKAGEVMSPLLLNGNEEGFEYRLKIVKNGEPLRAGDYYASLQFKIDYE